MTSHSQSKLISAETTESHLRDRMNAAREAFLNTDPDKGHYLGVSTVRDSVIWIRRGRADVLVDKQAAEDADQARKSQSLAESSDTTPTPLIDPAILTAVVTITPEDYWLTSCGMWKGPSTAAQHLWDVKPTCTGGKPEHPVFSADFPTVVENTKWFMEQIKTEGFHASQGLLVHSNNGSRPGLPKLKFRHVLFEVRGY